MSSQTDPELTWGDELSSACCPDPSRSPHPPAPFSSGHTLEGAGQGLGATDLNTCCASLSGISLSFCYSRKRGIPSSPSASPFWPPVGALVGPAKGQAQQLPTWAWRGRAWPFLHGVSWALLAELLRFLRAATCRLSQKRRSISSGASPERSSLHSCPSLQLLMMFFPCLIFFFVLIFAFTPTVCLTYRNASPM